MDIIPEDSKVSMTLGVADIGYGQADICTVIYVFAKRDHRRQHAPVLTQKGLDPLKRLAACIRNFADDKMYLTEATLLKTAHPINGYFPVVFGGAAGDQNHIH